METLMLILAVVGILVSGYGCWLSWQAKQNAEDASKEASLAKTAAEAASQEIKIKKNIESLSEVMSCLDRAISTLNKRLSGNIDRGANISTENLLLRECTALVSRNEEKIKNSQSKWRVQELRNKVEKGNPKYEEGNELKEVAEEIASCLKEMRQIFASENDNAIF